MGIVDTIFWSFQAVVLKFRREISCSKYFSSNQALYACTRNVCELGDGKGSEFYLGEFEMFGPQ